MNTDTDLVPPEAPAAETQPATTAEAPEAHRVERAPWLPLELLKPGRFQPRRRFNAEALQKLADNIARRGVQQAIVVREIAEAKPGEPRYEIVAGERRWRACRLNAESGKFLPPYTIPAFVRELDDFEAAEIALSENTERDDLHPLEEASGYENLLLRPVGGGEFNPPRLRGFTVEQIAERIGHKPNFVFGRLKLLELVPAAFDAFLDNRIQLKVAETLARMAPAEQERALPDILRGWAGEPYSHRQAVAYLRQHFMLKLGKAVFATDSADLVPAAGACSACPKRSSANPDLFGDGSGDDMCLDATCYQAKTIAHGEQLLEKARERGQTVLVGKAAEKVLGHASHYNEGLLRSTGHLDMDRPAEELTGSKKTLRTLLGPDFKSVVVVKGTDDDLPITAARLVDVEAALKARGLQRPITKSAPGKPGKAITAEDIKARRTQRVNDLLHERLPGALWKHLASDSAYGFPSESPTWIRHLSGKLRDTCEIDFDALQRAALGGNKVGTNWLADLDTEALNRAAIVMLLGDVLCAESWKRPAKPEDANALAADIEFDLPALREEVQAEVDAAIRDEIAQLAEVAEPGKAKAPARKTPARKKPGKATTTTATKEASDAGELTPEKALAGALARDAKPKPVPAAVVSAAAAWPFPGAAQ